MQRLVLLGMVLTITILSCADNGVSPPSGTGGGNLTSEWLIPQSQVIDGGPGKDGIPALEDPEFISVNEVNYLSDDDLILGFKNGNDVHVYPHPILDWHEIVNDQIGDVKVAVTYCPLTGTGIGWDRVINNTATTFGVSGLLYNSNLIPYDRSTDSNWSQIRLDCVNGKLQGEKAGIYQIVETKWSTWKEMYPESKVISRNTGFNRNYGRYPYGDYKTDHSFFLLKVKPENKRLPSKTRVLGVINEEEQKAYRFDEFIFETRIVYDKIGDDPIVVVGNKEKNFIVTFNQEIDNNTLLEFEPVQNSGDIILRDNEGNEWNIFGEAVSGSRKGQKLKQPISLMGYWFAFGAFYPKIIIYDD